MDAVTDKIADDWLNNQIEYHTNGEKWDCSSCYWKPGSCLQALILKNIEARLKGKEEIDAKNTSHDSVSPGASDGPGSSPSGVQEV